MDDSSNSPAAKPMNALAAMIARNKPTPTQEVKVAIREALAEEAKQDALIDQHIPPEIIPPNDERVISGSKLSKLVDDEFPFDDSQLAAIAGMSAHAYACLTGAAGTGKTTTTKRLVDTLLNQGQINSIDMAEYFKRGKPESDDPYDDYEPPQNLIPAVCLVGFTGRSTQMIKKNFPRDWHGNIMTIHRALAFVPEYYDDWDEEEQQFRKKMRFVPTYTADLLMPWDIIVIDEAGMVGLDLWHQLFAAMKPGCRIYMIGDINQLPPVHGRSVFGFAMAKWPSWELTHIHRQVGVDNPIVDNAWRVLKGQMPESRGKFQMVELKGEAGMASRQVQAMIPKIRERGIYDPIRDTIVTPINGNEGSRGAQLGQIPLNGVFALQFNPVPRTDRFIIDGGRERKQFAVGDKVMATKNDHEAGITNGMTGVISSIVPNGAYTGDKNRYNSMAAIDIYMAEDAHEDDDPDFSLEELNDSMDAISAGMDDAKEKRDRGPSSHIVTVRFGDDEHGFELPFATLSEVGSLMTAYVVTCHKMQGGESPTVIIIVHDAHKAMMFREWLYTAITRASDRCILLYTPTALKAALGKQKIKGATLKDKIEAFNALNRDNGIGKAVDVTLPEPLRLLPETAAETLGAGVGFVVATPDEIDAEFEDIDSEEGALTDEIAVERVNERPVEPEAPKQKGVMGVLSGHVTMKVIHEHVHIIEREPAKPTARTRAQENAWNALMAKATKPIPGVGTREQPALPAPEPQIAEPEAQPKPSLYEWSEKPDYMRVTLPAPDPEIVRLRDAIAAQRERFKALPRPEPEVVEPTQPIKRMGSFGMLLKK